MVVQGDDNYAAFKTSRHSNYKQGIANSLGIFECSALFEKSRVCYAIIASAFQNNEHEHLSKLIDELLLKQSGGFENENYQTMATHIDQQIFQSLLPKIFMALKSLLTL